MQQYPHNKRQKQDSMQQRKEKRERDFPPSFFSFFWLSLFPFGFRFPSTNRSGGCASIRSGNMKVLLLHHCRSDRELIEIKLTSRPAFVKDQHEVVRLEASATPVPCADTREGNSLEIEMFMEWRLNQVRIYVFIAREYIP